jgi:hypothetical protein
VIQQKRLDDSAETLGRFSLNYWTIQLKLFDDAAETICDSAETLG